MNMTADVNIIFYVLCFMLDICEAQTQHWQHTAGGILIYLHPHTDTSEALCFSWILDYLETTVSVYKMYNNRLLSHSDVVYFNFL